MMSAPNTEINKHTNAERLSILKSAAYPNKSQLASLSLNRLYEPANAKIDVANAKIGFALRGRRAQIMLAANITDISNTGLVNPLTHPLNQFFIGEAHCLS